MSFWRGESKEAPKLTLQDIECIFVFSILWGFRNDLNSHGKAKFSEFLKNMCSNADFIYEHEIYTILTEDYKWTNLGIELSLTNSFIN